MSDTEKSDVRLLQYVPFSSAIDVAFWHHLSQLKLDVYALDDQPVTIWGYYSNTFAPALPSHFNIDYSSFNPAGLAPKGSLSCQGVLHNKNTLETFKECDKTALIESLGHQIWFDITSGGAILDPSLLSRFLLFTYTDLKKYHYYYWFAFPALVFPERVNLISDPLALKEKTTESQRLALEKAIDSAADIVSKGYFVVFVQDDVFQIYALQELPVLCAETCEEKEVWLAFVDPSTLDKHPGWPLRNLLALVAYHWPSCLPKISVLCWRDITRDGIRSTCHSLLLRVHAEVPAFNLRIEAHNAAPKCIGWEKNEKGKMGPRRIDLSKTMDPHKLAESAVDLNLKLMKWRLLPTLNLEILHSTKCLIIGAGTLGCYVSRLLMAWGLRKITFVDHGHVSYSNPVRQSLFTFNDCLNGGKAKAQAAADGLAAVFPGVQSTGINLRIPMPGHLVIPEQVTAVQKDLAQLSELIQDHDVIFLLTDTRESRWLPTMLGAYYGKLVMNAALGFDSYLVMRHGYRLPFESNNTPASTSSGILKGAISGHQLGCYFCMDVVAPGDSTRDRTLDQQCTVTRPGISLMASALVVELLISVLQHPLRGAAPADIEQGEDEQSILGLVPHSVRGFLSRQQIITPATEAYDACTACSPKILAKYKEDGNDFLIQAFNNPALLESITGLEELHKESGEMELWEVSDDESDDNQATETVSVLD